MIFPLILFTYGKRILAKPTHGLKQKIVDQGLCEASRGNRSEAVPSLVYTTQEELGTINIISFLLLRPHGTRPLLFRSHPRRRGKTVHPVVPPQTGPPPVSRIPYASASQSRSS